MNSTVFSDLDKRLITKKISSYFNSQNKSLHISFIEEKRKGTATLCSWNRLLPYLADACGLKQDQKIIGVVIDENGITMQIDKQNVKSSTPSNN